jgi:SAM-dependent methyltransferase
VIKKTIKYIFGHNSFGYKFYWNYRFIKRLNFKFVFINFSKIYRSSKIEFYLSKKFEINKKDQQEIYEGCNFDYDDWFTGHIPIWKNYLPRDLDTKYLEIGSFEGRSSVFVGKYFKNLISIDAVDTFFGSDEHPSMKINFEKVFSNFKNNTAFLNKKIFIHKMKSEDFFKNNKKKFNIIYIDGSHHYNDVLKDLESSYKILDPDGIILCDDFLWNWYKDFKLNPGNAIIDFLKKYKMQIIHIGNQVILKKRP